MFSIYTCFPFIHFCISTFTLLWFQHFHWQLTGINKNSISRWRASHKNTSARISADNDNSVDLIARRPKGGHLTFLVYKWGANSQSRTRWAGWAIRMRPQGWQCRPQLGTGTLGNRNLPSAPFHRNDSHILILKYPNIQPMLMNQTISWKINTLNYDGIISTGTLGNRNLPLAPFQCPDAQYPNIQISSQCLP